MRSFHFSYANIANPTLFCYHAITWLGGSKRKRVQWEMERNSELQKNWKGEEILHTGHIVYTCIPN